MVTKEQLLGKMKIVKLHIDTNDFDFFVEFDKTFDRLDTSSGIKRVPENFGNYLNDRKYKENENLPMIFDTSIEMKDYLVQHLFWLFKELNCRRSINLKRGYEDINLVQIQELNSTHDFWFRIYKFTDAEYIERYFFSISNDTIDDILEFLYEGGE